jgi:methylthioribose-1-phosphate isomerase
MADEARDAPGSSRDAAEPDLERRLFFRRFASDVFQAAATVVGAAAALQRESAEAASAILDPDHAASSSLVAAPAGSPRGFRTPFRFASGDDATLLVIDQRRLPWELIEHPVRSATEATWAIRNMVVRGAPAIGQVAAIGIALTAHHARAQKPFARRAIMRGGANALRQARPTAVNLGWAIDRMMARYEAVGDLNDDGDLIADALRAEADAIVLEATTDHGRLAEFGLAELPQSAGRPLRILTHCNTGPLACGQFGTALGIVQAAHHAEREIHVLIDETRPYLQGARLTAWELAQAGVPHAVIADAAAGHLIARGEVDVVLVGADRVVANGDTANKIGTYSLAVLEIEERPADEVLQVQGRPIAPEGTDARNPAFDVTPAELITAVVTDEGVIRPPFGTGLADAVRRSRERKGTAASAEPTTGAQSEPVRVAS